MAYKSPLAGYENAEPLPTTLNADGRTLYNPPGPRSIAYDKFLEPIRQSNNGFDFHVYYMQHSEAETKYAKELHERIRREFPELSINKIREQPVGPHPVAQFEVGTFTPHQTGALFSWLTVYRGPLSVLVHPNAADATTDHTEFGSWMGKPWPLLIDALPSGVPKPF